MLRQIEFLLADKSQELALRMFTNERPGEVDEERHEELTHQIRYIELQKLLSNERLPAQRPRAIRALVLVHTTHDPHVETAEQNGERGEPEEDCAEEGEPDDESRTVTLEVDEVTEEHRYADVEQDDADVRQEFEKYQVQRVERHVVQTWSHRRTRFCVDLVEREADYVEDENAAGAEDQ